MTSPVDAVAETSVETIVGPASSGPHGELLAVEEPLEIRLGFRGATRSLAITMRTPGYDFELAAGFLFSESIVRSRADIASLKNAGKPGANVVRVDLAPSVDFDPERLTRHFYVTSSCGVCGKASLDALANQGCEAIPRGPLTIEAATIHGLPDALRREQAVFDQTGGLHAACLFDANGSLVALREDVGRHNALDKLIGSQLLAERTPLTDSVLLVSGRASFELVQKALVAGIPVLAAVGAPSSLAVDLAREFDMTLAGFVRGGRFNIYSGEWRIRYETATGPQLATPSARPE